LSAQQTREAEARTMASDLFNSMNTFNTNDLMKSINELKSKVSDPNAMIQQMLNSGRISQKDYNNAVLKANQIINLIQRAR
jgi:hypothetical protein